jgi:sugar transferase EpsL
VSRSVFWREHKRAFDVFAASALAIITLPFLIFLGLVVGLVMGRPVLFQQERIGRAGRVFVMIKFRTMRHASGRDGRVLSDAERLTRFGSFLRSTSLDELPEIWNVLLGDMSFVGPRPLLPEYLPLYSSEQARRHEVRPGITGWAQINGRNAVSWPNRLAMDVWYVNNVSCLLDCRILFLTVVRVVSRSGVNAAGHATVEKFRGEG